MTILVLGITAGTLWVGGAMLVVIGIKRAPRGYEGGRRFYFGERAEGVGHGAGPSRDGT